jgi:hypothetical protein
MPDLPPGPYKVACAGRALQQLRACLDWAIASGRREPYVAAATAIQQKLATEPLSWGDPLFRLHQLGLVRCQGVAPPFLVNYAVDEQRRIVYVQDIQLLPNDPLNQGAP